MPAMTARRAAAARATGRAKPRNPRPRGTARTQAPGLGMMLGAWARARARELAYRDSARGAVLGGIALAVVSGLLLIAALAGALDAAGRAISAGATDAMRGAGLAVRQVSVSDFSGAPLAEERRLEVLTAAAAPTGEPMTGVDPAVIRTRVADLSWVEEARVLRLWPDQIVILVRERAPTALWRGPDGLAFIDPTGAVIGPAPAGAIGVRPLILGAAAPAEAPALLQAVQARPEIADRFVAARHVGARRWTVTLRSGAEALRPAGAAEQGLDRLVALHRRTNVLDLPVARIDLRHPRQVLVRPQNAAPVPSASVDPKQA